MTLCYAIVYIARSCIPFSHNDQVTIQIKIELSFSPMTCKLNKMHTLIKFVHNRSAFFNRDQRCAVNFRIDSRVYKWQSLLAMKNRKPKFFHKIGFTTWTQNSLIKQFPTTIRTIFHSINLPPSHNACKNYCRYNPNNNCNRNGNDTLLFIYRVFIFCYTDNTTNNANDRKEYCTNNGSSCKSAAFSSSRCLLSSHWLGIISSLRISLLLIISLCALLWLTVTCWAAAIGAYYC